MARVVVGGARLVSPGRVWLAWLAANVVPSVAVSVVLAMVSSALGTDASAVVAYVVLFVLVALMQARVWSRLRATAVRRWTVWTLIGLCIAMFFGVGTVATLDGLGHERLGLAIGWAIAGLILGIAQAPMLGVAARHAVWWVVASVLGWLSAAVVYSPLAAVVGPVIRAPGVRWLVSGLSLEGNIELAITAVTFAVYGILTGAVLASLTRSQRPEA